MSFRGLSTTRSGGTSERAGDGRSERSSLCSRRRRPAQRDPARAFLPQNPSIFGLKSSLRPCTLPAVFPMMPNGPSCAVGSLSQPAAIPSPCDVDTDGGRNLLTLSRTPHRSGPKICFSAESRRPTASACQGGLHAALETKGDEALLAEAEEIEGLSPLDPRLPMIDAILAMGEVVRRIDAMDLLLVDAPPGKSFVLGDAPVALSGLSAGFATPLSPSLALCAWSGTYIRNRREADPTGTKRRGLPLSLSDRIGPSYRRSRALDCTAFGVSSPSFFPGRRAIV